MCVVPLNCSLASDPVLRDAQEPCLTLTDAGVPRTRAGIVGISRVGTRAFLQWKTVLGQAEMLSLVSWKMAHAKLDQLCTSPNSFSCCRCSTNSTWVTPTCSRFGFSQCLCPSTPRNVLSSPARVTPAWIGSTAAQSSRFTAGCACPCPSSIPLPGLPPCCTVLLPGSDTHPGDTTPPQCHLLWTKRLSLTLTVISFQVQDSYLPISLVTVWFSFYVEFKPEVHSAQTVKSQPYSPLLWLIRLHTILIHKKLLQRWIHSIQAFLFIYPGALWSCGSLYLITGAKRGSYRISWCTLLKSGFSFSVWGRRVQFLEAQLFNFNILQVQE